MDEKILGIMREIFEDESVDTSCSQTNCVNWDSLHHLNLISDLEDEFDIEFEPEEIAQMTSFDSVKHFVSLKC